MKMSCCVLWLVVHVAGVVCAETPNFACEEERYAHRAERVRAELAMFWTNTTLPKWHATCKLQVKETQGSGGGSTQFYFDRGEVGGWDMQVQGSPESLMESVIPHEVNHTIFASLARRPLQRWLDEGVAQLFESPQEHARLRGTAAHYLNHEWCAWRKLDHVGEYPRDGDSLAAVYSTGYVVVEWLLQKQDKDVLLRFVLDERAPSQKLLDYYGLTAQEAEQEWRAWFASRPVSCAECSCYIHSRLYHEVAKEPTPTEGGPTLFAVGNDACFACVPYTNHYNWDPRFRAALWARVNVVKVDGYVHRDWLNGLKIYAWPAFVLRLGDKDIVIARSYPGKTPLIEAIDRALAEHRTAPQPVLVAPVVQAQGPVVTVPGPNSGPVENTLPDLCLPYKNRIIQLERELDAARSSQSCVIPDTDSMPGENSGTPRDPIVTNPPRGEGTVERPPPVGEHPDADQGGWSGNFPFSGRVPWGALLLGAATVAGIGIPAWAAGAARAAKGVHAARKTIKERRDRKRQDEQASQASSQAQPQTPGPARPSPGNEYHYVVDAPPPPMRHRIDTRFVEVESDRYAQAHEQARAEVARRYPGSQEVLEAEKNLTRQFLAGMPPR